jgi:hypothetical protein
MENILINISITIKKKINLFIISVMVPEEISISPIIKEVAPITIDGEIKQDSSSEVH